MEDRAILVGDGNNFTLKEFQDLQKHACDLKQSKTSYTVVYNHTMQLYEVLQVDCLSTLPKLLKEKMVCNECGNEVHFDNDIRVVFSTYTTSFDAPTYTSATSGESVFHDKSKNRMLRSTYCCIPIVLWNKQGKHRHSYD